MTDTLGAPNAPTSYQPIPYRVDADETVTCPRCQLMNDSDASYCDQCGSELAGATVKVGGVTVDGFTPEPYDPEDDETVQCPSCQKLNDPDARFCDQCGVGLVGRPDVNAEAVSPDEMARSKLLAPRDSVVRNVTFEAEPSNGQTLEGYAAVFDDLADIESWEGKFSERMVQGAFTKTINERRPPMMFDHGRHPLIGTMPIGTIGVLREDSHGLYVRAKLSDNWLVQPVRDAIRDGAITGMSVRMNIVKDDWARRADASVERSIKEVALIELGPVVFPAYENTEVSVRSREVATALTDPELRADLARIFASGTDLASAAAVGTEPGARHSTRSHTHRRATIARVLNKELDPQ